MNSLKNVKILFDKFRVILTKQQKSWAAVLFVMTVVGAIFEAAGVSAVLPLINVIIDPEALRNHEIGAKLLAPFPGITDEGIMFLTASGVIVVYIFKNLYTFPVPSLQNLRNFKVLVFKYFFYPFCKIKSNKFYDMSYDISRFIGTGNNINPLINNCLSAVSFLYFFSAFNKIKIKFYLARFYFFNLLIPIFIIFYDKIFRIIQKLSKPYIFRNVTNQSRNTKIKCF